MNNDDAERDEEKEALDLAIGLCVSQLKSEPWIDLAKDLGNPNFKDDVTRGLRILVSILLSAVSTATGKSDVDILEEIREIT